MLFRSSSGKTTFSHRLSTQFAALGYNPHPISVDNYFRNREEYPLDENGQPDFEALGCVDIPQFNEDMNALLSGKTINFHGLTLRPVRGNTKAKC